MSINECSHPIAVCLTSDSDLQIGGHQTRREQNLQTKKKEKKEKEEGQLRTAATGLGLGQVKVQVVAVV